MNTKLIIGLGNPGRAYNGNRHNIGFACLGHFARRQGIRLDKRQCLARIGAGKVAGGKVVLARPQTYMNSSGRSVSRLAQKFNISPGEIIVIYDDLDLPLGSIRIRRGSGSGGHKGIASVIAELGSRDFVRIRVGIGRPDNSQEGSQTDIISYVLTDFTPEEKNITRRVIATAAEAVRCLLEEDLAATMNKYNQSIANLKASGI